MNKSGVPLIYPLQHVQFAENYVRQATDGVLRVLYPLSLGNKQKSDLGLLDYIASGGHLTMLLLD